MVSLSSAFQLRLGKERAGKGEDGTREVTEQEPRYVLAPLGSLLVLRATIQLPPGLSREIIGLGV